MNFLQLCQRVRQEAGLSGTGPAAVTNQTGMDLKIVSWVSSAWEEIQLLRNDWAFAWADDGFTLVPGQAKYLPADYGLGVTDWVLETIRIDDGTTRAFLKYIPWGDFRRLYETTDQDQPVYFTLAPDGRIYLAPTPDDAYPLKGEHYRTPQYLTSNTDIPRCPARYHMAIVYKALMMYAAHDDAANVFADASARYTALLNKMESTELARKFIGARSLDGYRG